MTGILKKIFKIFFWHIGFEIKKINKEAQLMSFDEIYKSRINSSPIIFDIGANQGQSIDRFKKIFTNPKIYAFEPIEFEYDKLVNKYQNDPNIILNNFAVGEQTCTRNFYITAKTGNSSFNKIREDSDWLKVRSKQYGTTVDKYTKIKKKVKIVSLDDYCNINEINHIDLIKIDTQGYEDKILKGSKKILSEGKVSAIECEIMFDNVYDKYLNFSDLERYLIPNNFRMVGLNLINNNLFSGLTFFGDVLYFNRKKFNL